MSTKQNKFSAGVSANKTFKHRLKYKLSTTINTMTLKIFSFFFNQPKTFTQPDHYLALQTRTLAFDPKGLAANPYITNL